MASRPKAVSTRARKPWERRATPGDMLSHRERTRFLAIPRKDWPKILTGEKTEIRWGKNKNQPADDLRTPTPIIGYSSRHGFGADTFRYELLVCEEWWSEPLGSISAEGLERECQPDLHSFRWYWKGRHQNARFDPLQMVTVFRIRPWREEDDAFFARQLLDWLYHEPMREGPLHS